MIPVAPTIATVRAAVLAARAAGHRVGFVPTMGALHAGHGELIRRAKKESNFVVVSVFVNPTQFGPNEDYARYPRTLDADRTLAADCGADLIFAPDAAEMYPPDAVTVVDVPGPDAVLDGPKRPGHFRGVATVVLKLFNIVGPDVAVFGAKDFQQSVVIRRMVADLNVPVEIVVAPTVRHADGLAMSSRNRYLSGPERAEAPKIFAALSRVRDNVQAGERDVAKLEAKLRAGVKAIPGARVDYATVLSADRLEPLTTLDRPAVAAVAVFVGTTRLIDNIVLSPSPLEGEGNQHQCPTPCTPRKSGRCWKPTTRRGWPRCARSCTRLPSPGPSTTAWTTNKPGSCSAAPTCGRRRVFSSTCPASGRWHYSPTRPARRW